MQMALKKIANTLWLLLIALIIVSGVLVAIGRLATPYLKDFKNDIEQEASRVIGNSVSIGEIAAHWKGFGPSLILRNIQVNHTDQQTAPLALKRVDLELSIKSIIQSGRLLPWNIVLHGINLQLIRDVDNNIRITGLSDSSKTDGSDEAFMLEPLFQMPRIELRNTIIHWNDFTDKTPDTTFRQINLLLRNDGKRHQLNLSFKVPGIQTQSLEVAADVYTSVRQLSDWTGDIYIKTRKFNITGWLKSLMPKPFELIEGRTDSDIWISAENGKLQNISGNTSWEKVRLWRADLQKTLFFDQLGTEFQLSTADTSTGKNWQLELNKFHLTSDDLEWPETRLSYSRNEQTGTLFAIDHIETRLWQSIASILLPGIDLNIPALELDGTVKELHASWNHDFSDWYAKGQLSNLTVLPEQTQKTIQLPAVKNLSASFQANKTGGILSVDSVDASYIHHGLFRNAIDLNQLKGDIHWAKTPENHWRISSGYLLAITPHLSTATRLQIDIHEKGKTLLDIQTDFHDGDATHASLYYPVGIMGGELVDWLDSSIISGQITSGSFILKGPLEDFAYSETHNGHFEVLFNTEQTVLDYIPQWPRLEEIDAEVRFHNNSLEIQVGNAKLLDTDVINAVARIDSLDPLSPIKISGTTLGPASDNLRILSESPLKKDFSKIASSLSITGDTKIKLDFQVPLGQLGKHKLDGRVFFKDNQLRLSDSGLQLDKISGQLGFDLEGLESKNLQARLLNSPIDVKISNDASNMTHFKTRLNLHTRQLQELVSAVPANIVSGKTNWDIDLQIPPVSAMQNKASILNISSELQGVAINAPAPLQKNADEKRTLSLTARLQPDSELPLDFVYDKNIHASLLLDTSDQHAPTLKSGQIHFGKKKPGKPPAQTISLTGKLESIKLDSWIEWLTAMPNTHANNLPLAVDLECASLSYKDFALDNFDINAHIVSGSLTGKMTSDILAGTFSIPDYKKFDALNIALERVALTLNKDGDTDSIDDIDEPDINNAFNPASSPNLNIQVKKLSINEHDFGSLILRSTQENTGMRLDTLKLESQLLNFDATGFWTAHETGQQSAIDFKLLSEDFGTALTQLGYAPQIAKGRAEFKGNIWWDDGPHNFNREILSGDLAINIQDGRFIDFEPGVGRVLGILNIAALQRRLTLDFTDLFKEGFAFDEISADFSLDKGDAYTNNLLIKSPSAVINLSGRTGLKSRDFDQLVTVTPSLQSTITIAGAVAGGPAGAAVAYVAQKLIGKQVDKIARTRYTITGPWENPEITKIEKPQQESDENDIGFSDH